MPAVAKNLVRLSDGSLWCFDHGPDIRLHEPEKYSYEWIPAPPMYAIGYAYLRDRGITYEGLI